MACLKVILWEDDPVIGLNIQTLLERASHEVWPVSNEAAAWQLCRERRPDMAILNFHFCERTNGLMLARRLINSSYPPRIYFITGAVVDEASVDGLPLLRKPFTQRQLHQFLLTGQSHAGFIY